jgi:hypothetical protein
MKDRIVEQVKAKLDSRSKVGIAKYMTTLDANNKDNFLIHAQEEAMDLCLYIEKLQAINKSIYALIRCYNNDTELGAHVRNIFNN